MEKHDLVWRLYEFACWKRLELSYRNVLLGYIEYDHVGFAQKRSSEIYMLLMPKNHARNSITAIAICGQYKQINDNRDIWKVTRKNKSFLKRRVLKSKITKRIDDFIQTFNLRIDRVENEGYCRDGTNVYED